MLLLCIAVRQLNSMNSIAIDDIPLMWAPITFDVSSDEFHSVMIDILNNNRSVYRMTFMG